MKNCLNSLKFKSFKTSSIGKAFPAIQSDPLSPLSSEASHMLFVNDI